MNHTVTLEVNTQVLATFNGLSRDAAEIIVLELAKAMYNGTTLTSSVKITIASS